MYGLFCSLRFAVWIAIFFPLPFGAGGRIEEVVAELPLGSRKRPYIKLYVGVFFLNFLEFSQEFPEMYRKFMGIS